MTQKVLILAALLPLVMASAACSTDDVGYPCKVTTTDDDDTGNEIIVKENSLDCESRLCVFSNTADEAVPQCSIFCESNDDCPGPGEIETCTEGFTCAVGKQTSAIKCCKLCICNKFLSEPSTSTFCNTITPVCPQL